MVTKAIQGFFQFLVVYILMPIQYVLYGLAVLYLIQALLLLFMWDADRLYRCVKECFVSVLLLISSQVLVSLLSDAHMSVDSLLTAIIILVFGFAFVRTLEIAQWMGLPVAPIFNQFRWLRYMRHLVTRRDKEQDNEKK